MKIKEQIKAKITELENIKSESKTPHSYLVVLSQIDILNWVLKCFN